VNDEIPSTDNQIMTNFTIAKTQKLNFLILII